MPLYNVIKYIITNANNAMNLTRKRHLIRKREKYRDAEFWTHHYASWLSGSFSPAGEGNDGLEDRFEPMSVPPSQAK